MNWPGFNVCLESVTVKIMIEEMFWLLYDQLIFVTLTSLLYHESKRTSTYQRHISKNVSVISLILLARFRVSLSSIEAD